MEIQRYSTKEKAKKAAAAKLNHLLDAHSHVPTLFLSSGGSSLELLDEIIIFPPNLTVGVSDERFSKDPQVNNFAQLAESGFFEKAQDKGAYFLDSRVQAGEDLDSFAERTESALKKWREEHPGGRIIITQGVGPDGHTLGIMPFPENQERFSELFENPEMWMVGYDAKDKNEYPLRATVTVPFLKEVDHAVSLLVGENKKHALKSIEKEQGALAETPARILQEMKDVHIFTDIP